MHTFQGGALCISTNPNVMKYQVNDESGSHRDHTGKKGVKRGEISGRNERKKPLTDRVKKYSETSEGNKAEKQESK